MNYIAKRCTDFLLKYNAIEKSYASVYIYGFQLVISFIGCVSCIIALSIFLNYFEQAIVFLLFFVPIRVFGGGYHAETYRNCFLLTNCTACICVASAKWLLHGSPILPILLGIMMLAIIIYIWRNVPAHTGNYELSKKTLVRNRKIARAILLIEMILIGAMYYVGQMRLVYTAMVTTVMVALLIKLVYMKGEKR